jgi:hypothetical protein
VENRPFASEEEFRKARGVVLAFLVGWLFLFGVATSFDPGVWTMLVALFLGASIAEFWRLRLLLGSYKRYLRLSPAYEAALAKRRANAKSSRQAIKDWSWITKGLVIIFFGGFGALILWFSLGSAHWVFALLGLPLVAFASYIGWASIR